VQRGPVRQHYSDGFRRFIVELHAEHAALHVEPFASAVDVPLGTLKDWLRDPMASAESAESAAAPLADAESAQMQTACCPKTRSAALCGLPPIVAQYAAEAFVASDRSISDRSVTVARIGPRSSPRRASPPPRSERSRPVHQARRGTRDRRAGRGAGRASSWRSKAACERPRWTASWHA
jgi:hypothetical protein